MGFGVGCIFNSSLSQMCCGTLLESSCSHSRIRVEEVAMVKMQISLCYRGTLPLEQLHKWMC